MVSFARIVTGGMEKYIDNRARKEFTVIQAHVGTTSGPAPNANGQLPFETDIPNRLFWTDFETKVEYANQQGIVVYIVGMGAQHVVFRCEQRQAWQRAMEK